ncbi:hypothetical protein Q3G72_008627 [Acer saccharum]|nr:hypothetical protein Q3G72_008627 [Acer saccharum]
MLPILKFSHLASSFASSSRCLDSRPCCFFEEKTADLETEVEWLNKIKADLVLLMLEFALFVSPTSEYVMAAGNNHRSIVWQGICHG